MDELVLQRLGVLDHPYWFIQQMHTKPACSPEPCWVGEVRNAHRLLSFESLKVASTKRGIMVEMHH